MRRRSIKEQLASVPLFAACSKRELGLISQLSTGVLVPADETLTQEGELGREFFIILDGRASVSQDGRKIGVLHPGDYFGEIALIEDSQRTATVVADTPMRLEVIERRDFARLLDEVPSLSRKLLRGMARIIEELHAQTRQAPRGPSTRRSGS
jgi:CRP/FNR family transcriptional regulator, cyclic AMP receptor protein